MCRDDLSESDAPVPTGQRNLTAESSFLFTKIQSFDLIISEMICRTLVVQCRRVGEIPLAESSFLFTK